MLNCADALNAILFMKKNAELLKFQIKSNKSIDMYILMQLRFSRSFS